MRSTIRTACCTDACRGSGSPTWARARLWPRPSTWPSARSATSSARRWNAPSRPPCLLAELTGLPVPLDERLIEAENRLEGRAVAGGRGLFADPTNWPLFRNPFRPSWGEPYVEIAARMRLALRAARDAATVAGEELEAACISHQLPIVIARRDAQGEHLFHDPRRRQCALGSVTSFTFDGDTIVEVSYAEPAADLPAGHGAGA